MTIAIAKKNGKETYRAQELTDRITNLFLERYISLSLSSLSPRSWSLVTLIRSVYLSSLSLSSHLPFVLDPSFTSHQSIINRYHRPRESGMERRKLLPVGCWWFIELGTNTSRNFHLYWTHFSRHSNFPTTATCHFLPLWRMRLGGGGVSSTPFQSTPPRTFTVTRNWLCNFRGKF